MAAKPAPKGRTAKHAASKHAKHHKGKQHQKHHPAPKPTHLNLQQQVARLVAADVAKTLKQMGVKQQPAKRGAALTVDGLPCCAAEALAASLRLAGKPVGADDMLTLFWHAGGTPEDGTSILAALVAAQTWGLAGAWPEFRPACRLADGVVAGLTLPAGPHSVALDGNGVRTWGEWRPAPASLADRIEEAWVITWQ